MVIHGQTIPSHTKRTKKSRELKDNPSNERDVRAVVCIMLLAKDGVRLTDLGDVFGVTPKTIHEGIYGYLIQIQKKRYLGRR
jgi:hypothetical protein